MCSGNTCRSPIAEVVLSSKLKQNKIKAKVKSCGVCAEDGVGANELSKQVCFENGYNLSGFKSTKITKRLYAWADIVICMTPGIKSGFTDDKAYDFSSLYNLRPIEDPYGKGIDDYRKAFFAIEYACNLLVCDIKNNKFNKII